MLRKKSDIAEFIKSFILQASLRNTIVKVVFSDNAAEYLSNDLQDFYRSRGISQLTSIPFHPEQNGIAERMNRTLLEKANCLLRFSSLPPRFGSYAIQHAAYVQNRIPSEAGSLDGKSAFEALYQLRPDLSSIKIFGSIGEFFVPSQKMGAKVQNLSLSWTRSSVTWSPPRFRP